MKVAIVHDWLTGMRGAEKCLEVFCELFPEADLFTLLHLEGKLSPVIESMPIRTSFVQKLPLAATKYRHWLPAFPAAIERLDFGQYDLIVSSSHCVAKGARPGTNALHVCYCYTPMRYVWDLYDEYFGSHRTGFLARTAIGWFAKRLRRWDAASVDRVHHFMAISRHVADRIQRHYGRTSDVIHPPVDCSFYVPGRERGEFFLIVSAFGPYKRIDVAIEAFRRLGLPLRIIGTGQDEGRLRSLAGGNVEFLGWQSDEAIREHYQRCRAFVFPGEEDFGITPLEAMACGRPVIAFGRGGALETVVPEGRGEPATGVFFPEQTAASLAEAVGELVEKENGFDAEAIRRHAETFDRPIFKQRFKEYVSRKIDSHLGRG